MCQKFKSIRNHLSFPTLKICNDFKHQFCSSSSVCPHPDVNSSPKSFISTSNNRVNPRARSSQCSTKPHSIDEFNYIVSCNKMIMSYIRRGDLHSAMLVFENMKITTTITWNSILSGFSKMPGKVREAQELFDRIPEPDSVSYNTMLACYLNNADIGAAKDFFDRIPVKDTASWNTMISGFSQNRMMDEARGLFNGMSERNSVTWNAMISGYIESGDLESALNFFREAPIKGVVAWTAIVTAYMRCRNVEMAEKTFREMPGKNLVTWNAMIAGYVENGRGEDGLKLFQELVESGFSANSSTYSSVLLGCSNLSSLKLGKQFHQFVLKTPLYLNTTVGTSLISMYCKCGVLEDAWNLFLEMTHKDVVTWNAMISGYAQHGKGEKALALFDEMRGKGMKPDWITFVGVLSACNHAGLVDLGIQYFENMQKDYGIKAQLDHYTCMVDLLGRAGRLTTAVDLIKTMPFKPHSAMYGTLLGASRVHKNLEVAEFAAKNLLSLEPNNAAGYVQLANVYAARNRWEIVSRVRKAMKENKIIKSPGYSWIEVKNAIHEFRSGDKLHPDLEIIHDKLNELEKKMKLAGFVPDFESALHDVGEEQKGQLLLRHSEKLAIAFGLMRIPIGVPIRIFKNLRVCGDCHLATKFISAIECREIIVRDTTRFHHFKDGKCSCGDYW